VVDKITKLGFVGVGVVGRATYNGFSPVIKNIVTYDLDRGSIDQLYDRDFIFISLPAPYVDGRQDISIIHDVVGDIVRGCSENTTFILRSSVLPSTTDKLKECYGCKWCFNPEFLTDRSSSLDFINSNRFILGGDYEEVEKLYRKRFKFTPIHTMSNRSAEMVKYMINLFFMNKISFMNEMYHVSNSIGTDWDDVLLGFSTDGRIGNSHLQVPGFDGKFGFGGKCFPENIDNYLSWTEENGLDDDLIQTVRKINNKYRN
jgi:UDPglucose 6-dehydrogenase